MRKILTNKGIALLMVLWILMLLSVIVGEFCFNMKIQVNITRNLKESTDAYYIAMAGINNAIEQIVQQVVLPASTQPAEEDAETNPEEVQWRVNTEIPAVPYADGKYTVRIDNEGGKINLNLADKGILGFALNKFNLEDSEKDTIVDSILDWRDEDDMHRINGAENDYYESLPVPYKCKDGNFDSTEELLLVKGVTPEIFYGGLKQMVTVIPGGKIAPVGKSLKTKKKNQFDYNKLNINSIPPDLWATLPGMTPDVLAQIIEFRKNGNFRSPAELQEILGPEIYASIARYVTLTQSPYFTIHSMATLNDSKISEEIEAVVCITNRIREKYQVIQWKEKMPPAAPYMLGNEDQHESATKG